MPKPVKAQLSPQTKQALGAQFENAQRVARARGYDAGWHRGFRIGALLAFAVLSTAGLVIGGVAWVLT